MKREIKFRFFDADDKKMIYPDDGYRVFNGGIYISKFQDEKNIIQQYIGIKDRNDKDIYEGDVLNIINHDKLEMVEYSDHETAFGFFKHEDKERQNGTFEIIGNYCDQYGYEIVGNIIENPELLDV